MNLEENWPNNSNIYLSEPDQYHPFFRRDNILNNEKKNLKETKNLKAIRRKTNEKALTLSPKKFPLTRTFSKSSINKSSAKEKISRQNTFVLRKPKNIFLDEGDMSSDRSSKEEKIFDIDFIKKKPEELEIYDSLMEKVPKSQMKIIADNRFSTVIDSKSFCLTLQKDEAQQTIKPSKDSNKFNSGSIADNVLRHFVGKEKEFDQKSGLLKQMSMKFPARNSEIPKSRNSFLGFLKINNKVHDSASTDKNTMTTNKKIDIPLSKSSTPQKSEEESEIEISPTLKNEIEPPSSKSSPKSKTDYKAVQKKKDLEQLSEEVNFTPELTFDETKQNPKKSFNLQLSQKDETKDSKVISNDFTLEDFLTLKNEIEREKKILEEEIQNVTMSKYTNIEMKLKGKFVQKWARAKWNIKAASRMRRLNEDIKCYGSSFNVTGIAHKLGQLEGILMKQKTLTIKNNKTYIFLPSSRFKIYWSYIVILLLIYTAYITPYRIAFADTSLEYDDWFFIETIIDILFLIDILITLNCAYFDSKGHIITSRLNIFLTYLKTWLILDILGIFPFYLIDQFTSDSNSSNSVSFGDNYNDLFKFLRLPRLYRLIRIARLVKFIKKAKTLRFIEYIQDFFHLNNGSIKLIKFLFTISVIVHIVGCMWFFLAKIQNFAPDTWVAQ